MNEAIAAVVAGGFTFGLFGSLHCIGMCGGIVSALGQAGEPAPVTGDPTRARDPRGARLVAFEAIPYHIGRIASYSVAGGAAGALGASFAIGMETRWLLRLVAGLLLIAAGAYVAGWWLGLSRLERLFSPIWQRISPLTSRLLPADTVPRRLALGALWGWLPCGLVYSALVLAAASGHAAAGALTMAAFGLGTAPSLLAVGAFGRGLTRIGQRLSVRRGAGFVLCVFGLWTIFGPGLMPGGGHGSHGGQGHEQAPPAAASEETGLAHPHHSSRKTDSDASPHER